MYINVKNIKNKCKYLLYLQIRIHFDFKSLIFSVKHIILYEFYLSAI